MSSPDRHLRPDELVHCPICGRELDPVDSGPRGWDCRCGEFVPRALGLSPFEGCTHGRNCNCMRSMRR